MENQIQPQPYWADFKIKVGLYAKQEENGETKRVLIDPKDIQFKFVVGRPEEDLEINNTFLKQLHGLKPADILLMPLGANREELCQTTKMVMEMAIRHGWRYAPRIHIELFGAKPGV